MRALRSVLYLFQGLGVMALIAMMLHLGLDILLRNLAHKPLDGTLQIVAELYMPFVVFCALGATQLNGEEIRVDLIENFVPQAVKRRIDQAGQLLMAVSACAIAWLTGEHAVHAVQIGERIEAGSLVIAAWPGKVVVALGFALLALAAVVRLFGKSDDACL